MWPNDVLTIDKIIPKGYEDAIEVDLMSSRFPWNYVNDVTNENYGNNSGLAHVVYDMGTQPSEWFPFIKPLVYAIEEASGIKMEKLLRIRIGSLQKTIESNYEYNTPHLDYLMPHYTACYYVNDSDGDTLIFDKTIDNLNPLNLNESAVIEYGKTAEFNIVERCSPKKGRLCIFDGRRFHSSTKPKVHDRRLVIAVSYIPNVS